MKTIDKILLVFWLITSLVGVVLILPSDTEEAVLRLSETHGPSAGDLYGLALVLVGSIAQWTFVIRNFKKVFRSLKGSSRFVVGVIFATAALLITTWSVFTDSGEWWMLGIGVIEAIFLWFIRETHRNFSTWPHGHHKWEG
jgi:hypothetical protein